MDIVKIFEENFITLDSICDSIHEGMVIVDSSKKFLFWNEAAKQIIGDLPEAGPPEEWPRRYNLFNLEGERLKFEELPLIKALNGEVFNDYRIMTKNINHPEGIILSLNGKPLRSGSATVGGITTFRDITAHVMLERTLQRDSQFYQSILNLMPGIVFIKDRNGRFIYGNKSFLNLLGVPSVIGKLPKDFMQEDMAETLKEHDQIVLRTGKVHSFDEIINWKNGQVSIFQTSRFPFYGTDGSIVGVCAVARDITAIKESQEKSSQLSKMAAIGTLAAEIAHEIKNPLTIMRTNSDVIRFAVSEKSIDKDLVSKKLEVLNSTIDRMDKVVNSLSALSKNVADEQNGEFLLNEVLDDVRSICFFRARDSKVKVEMLKTKCDDVKIRASRVQMAQVLLNLIINAIDAVENIQEPVIEVKCETNNMILKISVCDNGPGVPEEIRKKIFEPFFTTKEGLKGSGLGLSISRKIVEQHKGTLEYEHNDQFHSFTIKLPFSKMASQ